MQHQHSLAETNSEDSDLSVSDHARKKEKDKSKQRIKASNNRPKHNHSKIATDMFKEWFYENMCFPFPSDELKAEFADLTGIAV